MTDQDKSALLSKLRAEGVQAGGFPAYINDDSQPLQYRLGWNNCLSDCRAALASAPVADQAVGSGRNMFYEGLFDGETERQRDARLLWANDMRAAFERHTGNGWFDKDWHRETGIWAAAWKAATADSAPVAGEAISDKRLLLMMARWHLQMLNPDDLLDVTEFGRAAYAAGLADAAPQASEAVPVGIINAARYAGFTFLRHADGSYTLQPIVMATAQADKDGGDCAKGAGDDAGITASGDDLAPVFQFLLGEGPLRGVHFGERAPGAVGKWWWRQELRAALPPTPSVVKQSLTATQTGEKGESDA